MLNIEYPRSNLGYFFAINNSTDDSEQLLRDMYNKYKKEYRSFDLMGYYYPDVAVDTRVGSRRHIYPVLADLRNVIRKFFLNTDYDYMFTIDSDVLVKPNVLKELLALDTLAASAVIYNDKGRGVIGNAMIIESAEPFRAKHVMLDNVGDVFEADLSGACTLYKREVFERGFFYKDGPVGEDVSFSCQLKEAGIKFKMKKNLAYHCMTGENLRRYLNGKS